MSYRTCLTITALFILLTVLSIPLGIGSQYLLNQMDADIYVNPIDSTVICLRTNRTYSLGTHRERVKCPGKSAAHTICHLRGISGLATCVEYCMIGIMIAWLVLVAMLLTILIVSNCCICTFSLSVQPPHQWLFEVERRSPTNIGGSESSDTHVSLTSSINGSSQRGYIVLHDKGVLVDTIQNEI